MISSCVVLNVRRGIEMLTPNNSIIKIGFLILFFVIIIYLFSPKEKENEVKKNEEL